MKRMNASANTVDLDNPCLLLDLDSLKDYLRTMPSYADRLTRGDAANE